MERNLVRTAPQTRSMTWRVSPAEASAWSTSTGFAKAWSTSSGVSALNRLRRTLTSGFSSSTTASASTPMSSPSRS